MHLIPTSLITTAAFAAYSMLNMPNNHENVLSLDVNGLDEFGIQSTIFSSKAKAVLSGGHDTCFLATINIQGTAFLVQIDTGSSDTAIPHSTLNQYTGPSVSYTIPAGQATTLYDSYGDTSFWKGYPARLSTTLGSTSIAALAPIALMTVQSTSPVFINSPSQGLMGVAYPPLSAISSSPITVMDAWFSSGKMAKNKLAVHGCPYSLISQAWIDFGDETPYVGCAGTNGTLNIATVSMPTQSYFTLNVFQISVDGVPVPLPSTFQEKASSYYGGVNWSILDSCTSNIMIPAVQLAALVSKITTSGGLSASLQNSQYLPSFLAGNVSLRITDAYFNYKLLPTLSFTIAASSGTAGNYSSVTLTLGPRQYFQMASSGAFIFMISASSDSMAILGLPLFSAYHIVIDKSVGSVTFQRGCGCSNASDIYPTISTGNLSPSTYGPVSGVSTHRPRYDILLSLSLAFLLY